MHGNCKCGHHVVVRIVAALAWVAGVLFFWSSWGNRVFWGYDAAYWAWSVVVLVLLAKVSKFCGCCGWGVSSKGGMEGKNMCSHNEGCKCGDCGRCC